MNNNLPNTDQWTSCPPGTMTGLAKRLQHKQRQSFRRTILLASLLVGVGSVGGYIVMTSQQSVAGNYGQISCSDVQQLLPALINDTISEPDGDRVKMHLAKCDMCRDKAEAMERERASRESVALAWASRAAFQARNFRVHAFQLVYSR